MFFKKGRIGAGDAPFLLLSIDYWGPTLYEVTPKTKSVRFINSAKIADSGKLIGTLEQFFAAREGMHLSSTNVVVTVGNIQVLHESRVLPVRVTEYERNSIIANILRSVEVSKPSHIVSPYLETSTAQAESKEKRILVGALPRDFVSNLLVFFESKGLKVLAITSSAQMYTALIDATKPKESSIVLLDVGIGGAGFTSFQSGAWTEDRWFSYETRFSPDGPDADLFYSDVTSYILRRFSSYTTTASKGQTPEKVLLLGSLPAAQMQRIKTEIENKSKIPVAEVMGDGKYIPAESLLSLYLLPLRLRNYDSYIGFLPNQRKKVHTSSPFATAMRKQARKGVPALAIYALLYLASWHYADEATKIEERVVKARETALATPAAPSPSQRTMIEEQRLFALTSAGTKSQIYSRAYTVAELLNALQMTAPAGCQIQKLEVIDQPAQWDIRITSIIKGKNGSDTQKTLAEFASAMTKHNLLKTLILQQNDGTDSLDNGAPVNLLTCHFGGSIPFNFKNI
jgi:hypothetical protein